MLDAGLLAQAVQDLTGLFGDHVGHIEKAQRIRMGWIGLARVRLRCAHQLREASIDRLAPIGARRMARTEARHDDRSTLSIASVT
jgi:hypothetical protein